MGALEPIYWGYALPPRCLPPPSVPWPVANAPPPHLKLRPKRPHSARCSSSDSPRFAVRHPVIVRSRAHFPTAVVAFDAPPPDADAGEPARCAAEQTKSVSAQELSKRVSLLELSRRPSLLLPPECRASQSMEQVTPRGGGASSRWESPRGGSDDCLLPLSARPEEVLSILRSSPLLAGEPEEELSVLQQAGEVRHCHRYRMIGREGGKAEVSVILQGSVMRTFTRGHVVEERLGPGSFIASELLVDPRLPLDATYQAVENTTLLLIPGEARLAKARESSRCRLIHGLMERLAFFRDEPQPTLLKLAQLMELHYCVEETDLNTQFGPNLGNYLIVIGGGSVSFRFGLATRVQRSSDPTPWINEAALLDIPRRIAAARAAPGTKLLLLAPDLFPAFLAIAPQFRRACRSAPKMIHRALNELQSADAQSSLATSSLLKKAFRPDAKAKLTFKTQAYNQKPSQAGQAWASVVGSADPYAAPPVADDERSRHSSTRPESACPATRVHRSVRARPASASWHFRSDTSS
ncbi:hypothetical protein AB1Y20_018796 [Prymnesium parvum]|uniref:Cyclic nucleotide-binding domain-containing protein n=1 Tax=Prymnesium parvum TaxID=97485 RepID=A0AB34JSU4_PRYPA